MKICTKCRRSLPLSCFGVCRREADGLQDWCRSCKHAHYVQNARAISEKARQWRKANAERKKALDRAYYLANRDKVRANVKKYREANLEKIRVYDRSDARKHPDRLKKAKIRTAEWAKANPDRRLESFARRRARVLGQSAERRAEVQAFYRYVKTAPRLRCHWCDHVVAKRDRHVDHVSPLSKGGKHAIENLCCACSRCNLSKGSKTPEQFTRQAALL